MVLGHSTKYSSIKLLIIRSPTLRLSGAFEAKGP